ncbi:MAG: hypothetical protein ABIO24_05255 [Saprospiraceae bacterium]
MIACILIPYFAVHTLRSTTASKPLLLARYKGSRGKVYGACETAVGMGVKAGMSLSRARALCPEAEVLLASPGHTRRALEAVLERLSQYSQWVEAERHSAQSAVIYADIGRMTPSDGQQIGQQMIGLLKEQGFKASIGLAANKFTAAVAAAHTDAVSLVRKGEERAYLAPFSVSHLPLDAETARRLDLLGLRRMGQLATLPRPALIEQFGKLGGRLHHLSCGEDSRKVARYAPPVTHTASRQFETAIEDRLILESVLAALSAELMRGLSEQQLTCRDVLLTLHLEDHSEQEAGAVSREPISSSHGLYRAVERLLVRVNVSCGIVEVGLRVSQLAPVVPRQLSLFDPPQAEELHNVLIDLAERYGADCFYQVETHRHPARLPEFHFHLEQVVAA